VHLVCGVVLLAGTAWAQSSTTGAIAGVVKDTTGAVLPGATVEAASPALIEKVRSVVTDSEGNYKIVDLRPGTYSVTFTLPGFATVVREGIVLTTGFTASVSADLKVGAVEERIVVTGEAPLVDFQNVRKQEVLSRDVIDQLPTGKTYAAYAELLLGTSRLSTTGVDVGGNKGEQPAGLSFGVHGVRGTDTKQLEDGMYFNSIHGWNGSSDRQHMVDQMAVQEVTIATRSGSAEVETGGLQINMVPKEGANTFKGSFVGIFTNGNLQQDNVSDEIRNRGLTRVPNVKEIYDGGASLGGPIKQDKLWFFTAHRWWGAQEYQPGAYFNGSANKLFYTPDLSRPAYADTPNEDHMVRLTWQVSSKQKIATSLSIQWNCTCYLSLSATTAPEATVNQLYHPVYLHQVTWSYVMTPRLVIEAGNTFGETDHTVGRAAGVGTTEYSVTDLATGVTYGSHVSPVLTAAFAYGPHQLNIQTNQRFSVTYVTGTHSFKTGMMLQEGWATQRGEVNNALSYTFRNGAPVSLTEWASPAYEHLTMPANLGIYTQDQWTASKRITVTAGLRFDYINVRADAAQAPGGRFYAPIAFPEVDNLPNWKDISPRLGLVYDLFGDARTALKASLGRYVSPMGIGIADAFNPINTIVTNTTRQWRYTQGPYVPNCDLSNPADNGDCGPINNTKFGTPVPTRRFDPDLLNGWGRRPYSWQASVLFQRQLQTGIGLNAGYYRTWYGNFAVIQNAAVTPANYDPFCLTAPSNTNLPNGGGYQLCAGLWDITLTKFGIVDNVVTRASKFGNQQEYYDGFDVSVDARFGRGGLLRGGVSTGRSVSDFCYQLNQPELATFSLTSFAPLARSQFCRQVLGFSDQIEGKFSAIYPLPYDLQISTVFQSYPGLPISATYAPTNAEVAPSLNRNSPTALSGTLVLDLINPVSSKFENRMNQLDVRLTKVLRIGRTRVQGMFDVFNLFNASTILGVNTRYGPAWLHPTGILGARLFKFGAQVDF
jgi:hypothetical protein